MKRLVVGLLAHVDSGKTTLAEGLLYRAGVLRKLGRVDCIPPFSFIQIIVSYPSEKNHTVFDCFRAESTQNKKETRRKPLHFLRVLLIPLKFPAYCRAVGTY